MSIKMATAEVRYHFNIPGAVFQLRYNHDAVTSFADSRTEPIKTTGQNEPGNIAASPMTE